MKRDSERKASHRAHWLTDNSQALTLPYKSYLNKEWDAANSAVIKNRNAVVLFDYLNEKGTLVPADLIYRFLSARPECRKTDLVKHVDIEDFKENFEHYANEIQKDYNFILLKEGKPHLAYINRLFRLTLHIKEDAQVDFLEEYIAPTDPNAAKATPFDPQDEKRLLQTPFSVSDQEALLLDRIIQELEQSNENFEQAVAKIQIA